MLIIGLTLLTTSIAVLLRRDKSLTYAKSNIMILVLCVMTNYSAFTHNFQYTGISLFHGFFHNTVIIQIIHLFMLIISILILKYSLILLLSLVFYILTCYTIHLFNILIVVFCLTLLSRQLFVYPLTTNCHMFVKNNMQNKIFIFGGNKSKGNKVSKIINTRINFFTGLFSSFLVLLSFSLILRNGVSSLNEQLDFPIMFLLIFGSISSIAAGLIYSIKQLLLKQDIEKKDLFFRSILAFIITIVLIKTQLINFLIMYIVQIVDIKETIMLFNSIIIIIAEVVIYLIRLMLTIFGYNTITINTSTYDMSNDKKSIQDKANILFRNSDDERNPERRNKGKGRAVQSPSGNDNQSGNQRRTRRRITATITSEGDLRITDNRPNQPSQGSQTANTNVQQTVPGSSRQETEDRPSQYEDTSEQYQSEPEISRSDWIADSFAYYFNLINNAPDEHELVRRLHMYEEFKARLLTESEQLELRRLENPEYQFEEEQHVEYNIPAVLRDIVNITWLELSIWELQYSAEMESNTEVQTQGEVFKKAITQFNRYTQTNISIQDIRREREILVNTCLQNSVPEEEINRRLVELHFKQKENLLTWKNQRTISARNRLLPDIEVTNNKDSNLQYLILNKRNIAQVQENVQHASTTLMEWRHTVNMRSSPHSNWAGWYNRLVSGVCVKSNVSSMAEFRDQSGRVEPIVQLTNRSLIKETRGAIPERVTVNHAYGPGVYIYKELELLTSFGFDNDTALSLARVFAYLRNAVHEKEAVLLIEAFTSRFDLPANHEAWERYAKLMCLNFFMITDKTYLNSSKNPDFNKFKFCFVHDYCDFAERLMIRLAFRCLIREILKLDPDTLEKLE